MGKKRRRQRMPHQNGERAASEIQKELVFVGIPCVGDHVHVGVQRFLAQLDRLSWNPNCPFAFAWHIELGKRPVQFARNLIVGAFLQTEAQRLWFIDADMLPDGDALRLLQVDADIVAPVMYSLKRSEDMPRLEICAFKYNVLGDYKFNALTKVRFQEKSEPVVDVDAVGTGCVVIRRKVIEDKRLWLDGKYEWHGRKFDVHDYEKEGKRCPAVFQFIHKPNGEALRGEDLDFSYRAGQLGYKIKLHAGVMVGHCKYVNLSDVATYSTERIKQFIGDLKRQAEQRGVQPTKEGSCPPESSGSRAEAGEQPEPKKTSPTTSPASTSIRGASEVFAK